DLDALAAGELRDRGVEIDVQVEAALEVVHLVAQRAATDRGAQQRARADGNILQPRQRVGERRAAPHRTNAGPSRGGGRALPDALRRAPAAACADHDLPLIGGIVAGQDVDQRGLAGTVVAEQGDDLAAPDVEIEAVDRRRVAAVAGDAGQLEDGRGV